MAEQEDYNDEIVSHLMNPQYPLSTYFSESQKSDGFDTINLILKTMFPPNIIYFDT